jgi:hypothetical protein
MGIAVTHVIGAIGNHREEEENAPRQCPHGPTAHITVHPLYKKASGAGTGADTGIS